MKSMADQRPMAFAKTTRPAITAIVPRERLFARLDGAPGRTVAWISGPPGSGKTALAASYVEARSYGVLWYQVDPDDADVATFFHYLGHAATKLKGSRARDLPKFPAQPDSDLASFSRKFFRQLFSGTKAPFALVIDNLHLVGPELRLHAVLQEAFGQIPKNCCVIVTSRGEPAVTLARLRVTGEMVCVSGENLRFDAQELTEVAKLRGQALAGEAAAQLEERTRGWAAGIVLMLEHAKLSGQLAEFPGDATPQAIFDYLAGEIFERFEPKTQQFLLRIACLPRMTAEVAEALSGEAKAGRLLINLSLNDYFVSDVHAKEGRVFQLHPLLRDFLLSRAAQDLPEALGAEQLKRAAVLLRGAGHIEDAVSLLIESRDWAGVARLASEEAGSMLAQGRSETLAGWLELIPAALLEENASLLHALGVCRSQSSPRTARRLFERAYEKFRGAQDARGMLASCCGVVDATIVEFDDLAPLDRWIGMLAELLNGRDLAGADSLERTAASALIRAMLLRDPGHPELGKWLGRLGARVRSGEFAEPAPEADIVLALARATGKLLQGDFPAAGILFEQLASQARAQPPRVAIAAGLGCALHLLLNGLHRQALVAARESLAAADSEGVHAYDGWLHGIAAAALLGAGDRDAAREELQGTSAAMRRGDRAIVHYLRAWLAMLDDDSALASSEAKSAMELAAETGLPWLECLARVALGQLLAERDDRRGGEAQLRGAAMLAERLHSSLLSFAAQLTAAQAACTAGDEAVVLECLGGAFALGRENSLRYVPAWRAHAVAELCAVALRHGIEPEFARGLVRAHGLAPRVPPVRVPGWPWPFRIATLGRFELLRDGKPVEFSGKGPGRPVELLKVLIAMGGQNVRADQLADALWPHVDADYAHKSFTATLHRLRRLLDEEDALLLRDARLGLGSALIWIDTWALEQVLAELDDLLRVPHVQGAPPQLGRLLDEAFALYRGPFLPDESEQPGYIACREQIRARLLRCLSRIARDWEQAGRANAAADCYLRCIEADPLFEGPYRNLMLCYQRAGEHAEARATYERLRTILSARLKAMPSPETQAVFAALAGPGAR